MVDESEIAPERQGRRWNDGTIFAVPRGTVSGFLDFMRERGVAGFAIGFILGGAAQKLIQALMDDIINPFLGLFLAPASTLGEYTIGAFRIGAFVSALINFAILCFIVYLVFKVLHLEKLDKPK
ncbi:MAG: MscL family protein [Patescibacteria group bacterium]|nr:MscL family protein [Patescibacteria group bacterium]